MSKSTVDLASRKHIHFMGIGGSGMSAVAMIAKAQGFEVTGCDLQESTPYLDKLKKEKIPLFVGHSEKHLKGVDILTVTVAVFYQNKDHPELLAGKRKNLMQWQAFMGKYLQKGKRVICVTGTHGKSTTTTMLGLLYEAAGFDPTVEIGATVTQWDANYRVGKSNIFINEADEFYGNFLNFHPDIIVLNNIEFDHPDYFESEDHVIKTFQSFLDNLKGSKILIFNQDAKGIDKLFRRVEGKFFNELNLVGYTLKFKPLIPTDNSFKGIISSRTEKGTRFSVVNEKSGLKEQFNLKIPGDYNVSNALGVIALSTLEGISLETTKRFLKSFSGSGRRMELIGEKKGIKVYDDYAHHPTEVKATLSGLRQLYPNQKIICVVEPHMFSRTKILLHDYRNAFSSADSVLIAPIYKSRDKETFGVSNKSIVKVAKHKDVHAFGSMDEVVEAVKQSATPGSVIIVMGAGKSYKLARDIFEAI